MNVPRDPVFFTTWAWWTVLVAVLLHLARATPAAIAGGLFPITLLVAVVGTGLAVMCSTSNRCTSRHYQEYSKRHGIAYTGPQWDQAFSSENLSTHLFPLLLLSAALLARPAGSSYLHRAALSLLGPAVYVAWTYARRSSLDKVYNLPTSSVAGLVGGVLLLAFIPV